MVYIYSQIQYYLFQDPHRLKLNADAVCFVLTPVAMNAAHRLFPVSVLCWSHRDLLSWEESWDLVNYSDLVNVSSLESNNAKLHFSLWKSDETTVPFISDTWYLKQTLSYNWSTDERSLSHRKTINHWFLSPFHCYHSAHLWHFSKLLACAIISVHRTAPFPGKHYFILKIYSSCFWKCQNDSLIFLFMHSTSHLNRIFKKIVIDIYLRKWFASFEEKKVNLYHKILYQEGM